MTSMPFDAPIYQNPFHNASSSVLAVSLDDPNPSHPRPSDSLSYFDLARLDGSPLDDSYPVCFAVAHPHADQTTVPNDVFLYTSSQSTTTSPVQTVSPTEIQGHSPFCPCGSPGAPAVDPPSPFCGPAPIPQTVFGSSANVQHQVHLNPFFPSFPSSNGTLAASRRSYSPPISPERRHSMPSPQRHGVYHSNPFHRRSSWVAPPSAPVHMEGYMQYPFLRAASFSSECEAPYSIGSMSLSSISSHSLYTPIYNSPIESPLVTNNISTSTDGHFTMSAPLLPAKSVGTHLMTPNPQNAFAPAAPNAFVEDSHFIPSTLDVAQAILETPMGFSEEDIISFALAAEEGVDSSATPLPVPPSHLHSPQSLCQVQTFPPVPNPVTTPTAAPTDDSSITKAKECKSRPRNLQKESFAARHRIQVETSSVPTSASPSLVHRTRRGRPSGSSAGGEISTKFPGVPPSAPVDPRPAARRARQRKKNGGGDESYGGPEKKFKCDHCGQTFGRKEHVKRHVSGIHQQVKAYQCTICGMCCSRSDNLRQHMRAHERDGHVIG